MPTLRQLTCNVEWAGSRLPLQEYHTIYADGYVETLIAVPVTPTPFFVHLRSHGYIAPGLAMFVYASLIHDCLLLQLMLILLSLDGWCLSMQP